MAKKTKKSGPKDRSYVNKSQKHEVAYAPKRKTAAKKFGAKKSAAKKTATKKSATKKSTSKKSARR